MINLHLRDWKLKNKIILHMAVIGGLCALFIAFLYLNAQKNVIYSMSKQKTELLSSMIESSIYSAMKDGKMEEVQSVLADITATNDIIKIRILNPHGEILRSSSKDEHGTSVSPGTRDNLSSFLSSKDQSGTFFDKKQSRIQELSLIHI